MSTEFISMRGVRTHNLKNINLVLPRNKLVIITGLSGSGKSSLAFDTLYAEGQRRYVESLSAYARQFLSVMKKPDMDYLEGLSPAISIEQKSTSHNPRSTVGTITEIYDYLRLLFARIGEPRCPTHNRALANQTIDQMVDQVLSLPAQTKFMVLAPLIRERKGAHQQLFPELLKKGFLRVRINDTVVNLDQVTELDKNKKHTIEVIVDRLRIAPDIRLRLAESMETALQLSSGIVSIATTDQSEEGDLIFSALFACPICGYSIPELEPRMFSFNNPAGACPNCDGLGVTHYFDPHLIIKDPSLSLYEGAIPSWSKRNVYYFHLLKSVAKHYEFNLKTPFDQLTKKEREVFLHGSRGRKINFSYVNERGDKVSRRHPFEGIVPNMERRYRDTDSSMVREHLSHYQSIKPCTTCNGARLNEAARHTFIQDKTLDGITNMSISDSDDYFRNIKLEGHKAQIAETILKEVRTRLGFLVDVGLNYLTLNRSAETLSGGEAQRIRLASQIGAGLVGVMYILDEPSIGLHQRDNNRLLATLNHLKDLGNTVIVVEHDEEAMNNADYIVDLGPGAGQHGGEIVAQGSIEEIKKSTRSLTGQYLSRKKFIEIPKTRRSPKKDKWLKLYGAKENNLCEVDLEIPIGLMTCVTGVSGSGKSTLINHTLYPIMARMLNNAILVQPGKYRQIQNANLLDKTVDINQSPIGRTPRSNPATYTGLFTPVRELFASTSEARSRGWQPGRFSFNVKGGRCEACAGDGLIKVEMHFLPNIYVTCDQCQGQRYNRETLEVKYKSKNIDEVLNMTVEDAYVFFKPIPVIERKLKTLVDVGLSYIRLGQSATTLSGGEAQRIKLARELSKRDTGSTLYILDEPTTGLHFEDINMLLSVLHKLCDQGNTIIVIEHNLDVIKTADWIVDLGPEGGFEGGRIIATGTPEKLIKEKHSYTGQFLKPVLNGKSQKVKPGA